MYTRGRTLKFTAVLALVVLTLTGFSTGRGHGSHRVKSSGGGGGGGCSSRKQDHDSSSSSSRSSSTYRKHRSTPTPSSTGGSGGTALQDAQVVLVSCATTAKPYTTVEVTNPGSRTGTFTVRVTFLDAAGGRLGSAQQGVPVKAGRKATARVPAPDSAVVGTADHCDVAPFAAAKG